MVCEYKKYCIWTDDSKWYDMGCRRNFKYIFVDGGVKRKLNYMGGRVDKKSAFPGRGILISGNRVKT